MSDAIGHIRRAIVRGQREIRKMDTKFEKELNSKNINKVLGIINQDRETMNFNDKSIVFEIYRAIKDSDDQELGIDFLDTVQTLKLE